MPGALIYITLVTAINPWNGATQPAGPELDDTRLILDLHVRS